MKNIFLIVLGLFSLMTLTNCSSDEDSTMSRDEIIRRIQNGDFPKDIQDAKNLPEWLAVIITQAEEGNNANTAPNNMFVLRFSYQGQTYYLIASTYTSRTIYNTQGDIVFFSEDYWEEKCTDWVCIYVLNET